MMTFQKLYEQLVASTIEGGWNQEKEKDFFEKYDTHQLDCLLHPEKHGLVWKLADCDCSSREQDKCVDRCPFDAILKDPQGGILVNQEQCVGCYDCIEACKSKKIAASRDIIPAMKAVHSSKGLVYALVAPAFLGQFQSDVTPGKLRTALKKIGFDGMVEVALFADILTLKEALEFDVNIKEESDYQLTSCCCPMWIAMIRKIYHQLMPHVPGAVSPMIACGRAIKILHPDAVTIFIGPCLAKKAEAREKDLVGAIDYVLTFEEVQDIFEAMKMDPSAMEESESDHSSRTGRIYARSGGVSESVKTTVEKLNPQRAITVRVQQADGVPACKEMMNDLLAGKTDANFFEGMGCKGGCVGGPKSIIKTEEGRRHVEEYGDSASFLTPVENPYVIELLHRLGFDTVESLLEHSDIFTRDFSKI